MHATFALHADRDRDLVRVHQSDFSGWRGEIAPAAYAKLFVLHRIPTFVVAHGGVVTGVEGGDTTRAAADKAIRALPGTPAGSERTWAGLITDEGQTHAAAEWWAGLTATACVDLGAARQHTWQEREVVRGRIGGQMTDVEHSLTIEPAPCEEGAAQTDCERRLHQFAPDSRYMLRNIKRAMWSEGILGARVVDFSIRRIVDLLLRLPNRTPLRAIYTRISETTWKTSKSQLVTQVDTESCTYSFVPVTL